MFKVDFLNKKVYWLRNNKNGTLRVYEFDIKDKEYIMYFSKKVLLKDLNKIKVGGRYEKTVVLEVPEHE